MESQFLDCMMENPKVEKGVDQLGDRGKNTQDGKVDK